MTPAELHAWLTARWQEWADTARQLDWESVVNCVEACASDEREPERYREAYTNALSGLAAAAPGRVIAVCWAALRTLERHAPMQNYDGAVSPVPVVACSWCSGTVADVFWPCPEVLDLASVWATRGDYPEELRRGNS